MSGRPKKKVVELENHCEFTQHNGGWHAHFAPLDIDADGTTREEAYENLQQNLSTALQERDGLVDRWREWAEAHATEREYTDEEIEEERQVKEKSKVASASFRALDDRTLEEAINSSTPVLVDFWAEWCMPCHMMAPELKAAADELAGRLEVTKLNVDDHKEAWERFEIEGIPTAILFQEGKELHRILGAHPKDSIVAELTNFLGKPVKSAGKPKEMG